MTAESSSKGSRPLPRRPAEPLRPSPRGYPGGPAARPLQCAETEIRVDDPVGLGHRRFPRRIPTRPLSQKGRTPRMRDVDFGNDFEDESERAGAALALPPHKRWSTRRLDRRGRVRRSARRLGSRSDISAPDCGPYPRPAPRDERSILNAPVGVSELRRHTTSDEDALASLRYALTFAMSPNARDWAELALRRVEGGDLEGADVALRRARSYCDGPTAALHLRRAAELLDGR